MSKFNWGKYAPFFTPQEFDELKKMWSKNIEYITRVKTYRYTDTLLIVKLKDGTYRKLRTIKKKHSWRFENKQIDFEKLIIYIYLQIKILTRKVIVMEKEELLVEFLKNMGLDYRIDEGVTYKEYVIKSYYRNGNEMSFDFKKENGNLIFMGIYGSEDYE